MKISFTGIQSSGKTTLLKKCKEHYGDKYTYVDEVTRPALAKGLAINEQGGDETQMFIIQSHMDNALKENVIMDRCIIDGFLYTEYLYDMGKVSQGVWKHAIDIYLDLMPSLDLIFYTEPVDLVDDGVRSVDHKFREAMHQRFEDHMYMLEKSSRDQVRPLRPMSAHSAGHQYPFVKGRIVRLMGNVEQRFNVIRALLDVPWEPKTPSSPPPSAAFLTPDETKQMVADDDSTV
jgi:thymidylate kinase